MWSEKTKEGKTKFREQYKNPLTGRYNKVSVTFDKDTNVTRRKAQIALEQKIQNKLRHIQDGNVKKGVTLKEVIAEWEPIYKARVRPTTWQTYIVSKKHIEKYIGLDVQVEKITPKFLIQAYETMLYKDGYNNPTVKTVNFRMRSILRFAFRRNYTSHQPPKVLDVNWKNNDHNDVSKKYLDQDELPKVLKAVGKTSQLYEKIFDWEYLTGMRVGEILALRIKDIYHSDNGYFANVNGTLDYSASKVKDYVRQPFPKTDTSFRDVKLPKEAIEIFKGRKKGKKNDDFLFQDRHCWFAFTRLNQTLRNVKAKLELDKQLTTHTFRHTHVSKLAELGMPLYIIQDRLGHKDSETTREVYLHVTEQARKKYDNLLDEL